MENIFSRAVENLVNPQMRSASDSLRGLTNLFPTRLTEGAKKVNTNSALTISAFYCGVNTLANSYALLPHGAYQEKDGKRTHLKDHPVDYLLHRQPNNYHTAFGFRKIMMISILMRGNAYAYIERNNAGQVSALRFMHPEDVDVRENKGKLFYRYKGNMLGADEVIHVPGFSFDGVSGKSVIEYAADQLGVTLSAQKFGSDSLHNRGVSHGVIETDLSVKTDKKKQIAGAFTSTLNGGDMHRSAVLDEGFKYKPITLKPNEAQFIETYAAGSEDVARWLQIPAHKLAIPGEGGYNYLTSMEIDYLQRGVMPHGEAFKQEMERKIYTPSEISSGNYIYQNYKKLLQADPKARAQFYKDLYYLGAISSDEIRGLEDMNPREDGNGDQFVQMSNVLNEMQLKNQIKEQSKSNSDE